jgi:hypothetical protein
VTISGFSRFGEGPAFTPRLSRELIEPPLCERLKHESFDPRLGFITFQLTSSFSFRLSLVFSPLLIQQS